MALRVPKAELTAGLRESMIEQLGVVPEPVEVLWHNPKVAAPNLELGRTVSEWDAADASLKSFAHMAVAAQVGCGWCLDIGYFQAQNQNLDMAKASQVPRWRESEVFTPLERDVLEYAEAIGKSAAAVRQVARRAREHVAARRPRVRVSPSEQQAVVERFLVAVRTGQVQELMEVMAPDVVLIADGGGLVAAARAPIHGAALVAKMLARADRVVVATTVWLNGAPAGRIEIDGERAAVSLVVENGRITRIYAIANPRKLTRLDEPAELAR